MSVAEVNRREGVLRRLISAKEAAAIVNLPLTSFYEHVRAGRIPCGVRVGRRVLVDRQKLEDWIDKGGNTTEAQP